MRRGTRLGSIALALFLGGCGTPGGGGMHPAKGRTLSIACFGGEIEDQARGLVGDLLETTLGCEVEFELGTSRTFLEKLRENKGAPPPFDVVYLDGIIQQMAVAEGLLEKVEEKELHFFDDLTSNAWINRGYGPGIQFFSVGLAYNKTAFQRAGLAPPTSWGDLWILKDKLKGKIGVPDIVHSAGMDLVLATVELAGETLETPGAIERAVKKIQELEPGMVFKSSTRAAERLAEGELWLTPTYNSRAFSKELEGAPVGWVLPIEKGYGHLTAVCIVKGSRNRDLALAYLNVATSPAVQVAQSLGAPFGPTNTMTFATLGAYPEVSRRFPLGPGDFSRLKIPPWEEINKKREEIESTWRKTFGEPRE